MNFNNLCLLVLFESWKSYLSKIIKWKICRKQSKQVWDDVAYVRRVLLVNRPTKMNDLQQKYGPPHLSWYVYFHFIIKCSKLFNMVSFCFCWYLLMCFCRHYFQRYTNVELLFLNCFVCEVCNHNQLRQCFRVWDANKMSIYRTGKMKRLGVVDNIWRKHKKVPKNQNCAINSSQYGKI